MRNRYSRDGLLLPDNWEWSLSVASLRPTQARGVVTFWRKYWMKVEFVPNEYFSSNTTHLFHVADSFFRILDQYSGDPSPALIQAKERQLVSLCRSVVVEEKGQLLDPLKAS